MNEPIIQTFIVRVECEKPIPHLIDLVAGRTYTVDGVKDVTASVAVVVPLGEVAGLGDPFYKPA